MNIFKDITFKWYEAKVGQWFGISFALAIVTTWPQFVTWLNKWEYSNWAFAALAVVFAAYLVKVWFRK